MQLIFKCPVVINSMVDAVKLIQEVKQACIKYGVKMTDEEIRQKVENELNTVWMANGKTSQKVKKGEQLTLNI